ncbi:hypothetical protein [Legionella bononiensis]|uniref:SidC N-terminal domain-containing protein n=1 Tax=Legionella bononiensis TaxID=2793102 RepID=A0ABS1WFJ8_9GAMM|nr:hypothetical protein [Legionella bononiensis]MBL7481569.1 hypothetical protein [Legionella bononiensis]MBL7528116.1 hypothetical protein [Legionella bononiensis]MBL7562592.1 hypothetical protein [Legionella bononiensis]
MRISLSEPQVTRYLAINHKTNMVHLFVPFIAGIDTSTDNTCKATLELRTFFESGALAELNSYQSALEFDISLFNEDNPLRKLKEERLAQIKKYQEAIKAMQNQYGSTISHFLKKPSNLYSIQLRPKHQDPYSQVENPVFTINRGNNSKGVPLSNLYNCMQEQFGFLQLTGKSPRQKLIESTVNAIPKDATFEQIKQVLKDTCYEQLGIKLDFVYFDTMRREVEQSYIDEQMGFSRDTTVEEYVVTLLNAFAPNLETTLDSSPFYLKDNVNAEEQIERLSILTQFYLGVLNVYCRAHGLSEVNFGAVLDKELDLSNDLVETISEALQTGDEVERVICSFFNVHAKKFEIARALDTKDLNAIQDKFRNAYRTVTATPENPHMDDFMLLDTEAEGSLATFISYNGLICTDFANIVSPACANQQYFEQIRHDILDVGSIPKLSTVQEVEVDIDILINNMDDVQFDKLPQEIKGACQRSPSFHNRLFLEYVAKGDQENASMLLERTQDPNALLRKVGKFTDYSGRTFECTAYEYAYWAKDTHMRQMLESFMDEETKAYLLERIVKIEQNGLTYQQYGQTIERSKHFDLSILINALKYYVDNYDKWFKRGDFHEIDDAWIAVGKAQREVPAHVAQEYCRKDRSFELINSTVFNETHLPRNLSITNYSSSSDTHWFPLAESNSGLGFDYSIVRESRREGAAGTGLEPGIVRAMPSLVSLDLAALTHYDKVRTKDLQTSHDNLSPPSRWYQLWR